MDKPDFGIGPGRLHVIQWTDERRSYVEYLAEQGKSAADIAVDIGLHKWQAPRISAACLRFGITLKGQSGRKPGALHFVRSVKMTADHRGRLLAMAKVRDVPHDLLLGKIVEAVFAMGDTFIANMLDEE